MGIDQGTGIVGGKFLGLGPVVPDREVAMAFLTDQEMLDLTGYKQPAAQIRWLQKWRIRHTVSATGRPRVTWEALNGTERPRVGPNFDAMKAAG